MAYKDPLPGEICKLFEEFVIPKNVLPIFQQKKILEKTEIELVEAKTATDGPSLGARLLFGKLTQETDWFEKLKSVLQDKNVKLEHIANLMISEKNRIERQPASRRFTRYSSNSESMSALYIERNEDLAQNIRELFVAKIGDPILAVNVFRRLSHKVLTKIDADNVKAEVSRDGDELGARLLFSRLILYDSWSDVVSQVFRDRQIRNLEVAKEIELLASNIKEKYEKRITKIEHLYQINELPKLADNQMETDGSSSDMANGTRGRPLQDIFESDCAEMRPAPKRQPISYENKENSFSDGIADGGPDLASGRSSENRGATTDKTELMSAAASGNVGLLSVTITTCVFSSHLKAAATAPTSILKLDFIFERRPALKKQARSYKDKENSLSSGITEGDLDLASGGSSESRNATAGKTELMSAAASGNMGLLLCLIKKGANLDETNSKGKTALMYAVSKRKFSCVKELVSNGCDINKRDGFGCTALMISADKDFTVCMEYFIERNCDVDNVNDSGSTALMVAAKKGFYDCMRLLIRAGCNIDKCHNDGRTALMFAAFHGHSECVNLLIQKECNVNIADNKGVTALMFAAKSGHVECMNLLISAQADLNLKDEEGNTAVMYAVLTKQIECLKILIDRQADITIANNYGYTPLAVAVERRYKRCIKALTTAYDGRTRR